VIAHRHDVRRIVGAVVAAGAVFASASCAAGQQAQTAEEHPSIDGQNATIGSIQLVGVAIQPPSSPSYAAGASVPVSLAVVNNGATADTLTSVTSPSFSGWGIVSTTAVASSTVSAKGTPTRIPPGSSLRLGLHNLGGTDPNTPQTLVMSGLAKRSSPLFPGSAVKLTFTFAKAGAKTVTVPVQLTTVPNQATLPAPSGSAEQ
jgi:copper(I)-binding protein